MSDVEALREGIRDLLKKAPAITPLFGEKIKAAHTQYMERYAIGEENGIGHEANLTTKQNLWVRKDSINLSLLEDIPHRISPSYVHGQKPGRNSNLEQIPGFKYAELVCFSPETVSDAERVVTHLLDMGDEA